MNCFRFLRKINHALAIFSGVIILSIGILSTWGTITRVLLTNPNTWSLEVSQYLLIWAIFLGSAYAFQKNTHVAVSFIREAVGKRWGSGLERKLAVLGYILALVYVLVLTWVSFHLLDTALRLHKLTTGCVQIPTAYLYLAMVLGSILMVVTLVFIILEIWKKGTNIYLEEDSY
ncbi:MAG: TRAP transporter small permease [Armatimonadetes bacterium]|nr:TRAP transporter small permease [Armatimonadota bacterium]